MQVVGYEQANEAKESAQQAEHDEMDIGATDSVHSDDGALSITITEDSGIEMSLNHECDTNDSTPSPTATLTKKGSTGSGKPVDGHNISFATFSDSGHEMTVNVEEDDELSSPMLPGPGDEITINVQGELDVASTTRLSGAGTPIQALFGKNEEIEYEEWHGISPSPSAPQVSPYLGADNDDSSSSSSPLANVDDNMDIEIIEVDVEANKDGTDGDGDNDHEVGEDEENEDERSSTVIRGPLRDTRKRTQSVIRSRTTSRGRRRKARSPTSSEELEWSPARGSSAPRMGEMVEDDIDYNERGRPIRGAKTAAEGHISRQISTTRSWGRQR